MRSKYFLVDCESRTKYSKIQEKNSLSLYVPYHGLFAIRTVGNPNGRESTGA